MIWSKEEKKEQEEVNEEKENKFKLKQTMKNVRRNDRNKGADTLEYKSGHEKAHKIQGDVEEDL